MRALELHEIEQISGGAPTHWTNRAELVRADPGSKVVEDSLPGNRTGWCRGYGNMKDGESKHAGVRASCGCSAEAEA